MSTKKSRFNGLFKRYGIHLLVLSLGLNAILLGTLIIKDNRISIPFLKDKESQSVTKADPEKADMFNQINPEEGYEIDTAYRDLGPKLIEAGVIDFDKFSDTYEKSGQPLSKEQVEILQKGSNRKIRITRDNSYFLLNFFWAVGLLNKTKILDQGDMMTYGGREGAGNFASTGGWSLAKEDAMNYYSSQNLIPLTSEQEELVNQVASTIYRPCCDNSTAFPDCNHGMALLGVLQLMASTGAKESKLYEAAKYFNSFWFPGNYYDLALYFKNKENKNFKDVDPKIILSKEFSSASGWQNAKKWLTEKGIIEAPPKQSGGCGV